MPQTERIHGEPGGIVRWLVVAAIVIGADQLSKWWITASLALYDRIQVWPWFSIVRWHNEGAAFSMFAQAGGWQRWALSALAIGFSGFVIYEMRRLAPGQFLQGVVYGLILGGALGNLIDRLLHGYVVDFVLVHYEQYFFPAFNVADSALSVGAVLWLWLLVQESLQTRRSGASDD